MTAAVSPGLSNLARQVIAMSYQDMKIFAELLNDEFNEGVPTADCLVNTANYILDVAPPAPPPTRPVWTKEDYLKQVANVVDTMNHVRYAGHC